MKNLVILGAGTAGTIVANRMRRRLGADWAITVVDPSETHLYQPGLLFLPFGAEREDRLVRPRASTLADGVTWVRQPVTALEPAQKRVLLGDGSTLGWDLLVIATGCSTRPEMTEGLLGPRWRQRIFDFYTLEGSLALREALQRFRGGRLVIDVVEMPIKCPVAPLELAFLADAFLRERGIRDKTELVYVTPLDSVFTKPVAARTLSHLLVDRDIRVETEFAISGVDDGTDAIVSWDGRRVEFDLLVTVPTNAGASFLSESGLGDELGFVPTDPHTLQAKGLDHVFVVGDATDAPTSKAGSVAHFEAEVLTENLSAIVAGRRPDARFDGHANCFIETGAGKAMLVDFNYDVEPLPGRFPVPGVGPFTLLEESRANHWGKAAFRWIYFHALLPGHPIPISAGMSLRGKHLDAARELSADT
jgi:sulfide:quinone oxidoreductase